MTCYRHRPIVVDAIRLGGDNQQEVVLWARKRLGSVYLHGQHCLRITKYRDIDGRVGFGDDDAIIGVGYWLVRDRDGFHALTEGEFAERYEAVTEENKR